MYFLGDISSLVLMMNLCPAKFLSGSMEGAFPFASQEMVPAHLNVLYGTLWWTLGAIELHCKLDSMAQRVLGDVDGSREVVVYVMLNTLVFGFASSLTIARTCIDTETSSSVREVQVEAYKSGLRRQPSQIYDEGSRAARRFILVVNYYTPFYKLFSPLGCFPKNRLVHSSSGR